MPTPSELLKQAASDVIPVEEVRTIFRRKPLAVQAEQVKAKGPVETFYGKLHADAGDWIVTEANRAILVKGADFDLLYEAHTASGAVVDAGLPDLEPGTEIVHDGKRLVRVKVAGGQGGFAYWSEGKPRGADCAFKVVADMGDNPQASHRAGRFLEPFTGNPGVRTWVIVG
jgi:hypothetical protein